MNNKRRSSGSSEPFKRTLNGNTYWIARAVLADSITGRKKRKEFSAKTKKEALELRAKAMAENTLGSYIEPSKMTVGQWLEIWQKEYCCNIKPRTRVLYGSYCRNHIIPAIGNIRLSKLTVTDCQHMINNLSFRRKDGSGNPVKEGLKAKTKINIHGCLHAALSTAVDVGELKINVADKVTLPQKDDVKEIRILSTDEKERFYEEISGHKYGNLYTLALNTGMRESEILGLTWDCVNLEKKTITVKQQLAKKPGNGREYILATTKTKNIRYLSIDELSLQALKDQKMKQNEWRKNDFRNWSNPLNLVFTNEHGHNLCIQTVLKPFKTVAKHIGCDEMTFHALRHTFATTLIMAGVPVSTVSYLLGHRNVTTTYNIYYHFIPEMKTQAINVLNAYNARYIRQDVG